MKRRTLTTTLILLALASCSKSNDNPANTQKVCYTFTFSQSVGGAACDRTATLDTCIDPWVDILKLKFSDKCGNELGWTAKPK